MTGMMPINEMYEGYYSGETSSADDQQYTPQSSTPVPPKPVADEKGSPLSRKKKARAMAKQIVSAGQSWRGDVHFEMQGTEPLPLPPAQMYPPSMARKNTPATH